MDYTGTMSRGWQIVWKNKWLVLLTMLPTLIYILGALLFFVANPIMRNPYAAPEEMMAQSGVLLLLVCLSLVIYLVGIVGYLAGQGGQIAAVARLARGEATSFGASFREGWRAAPRLFGLGLLLYGVPVILSIVAIFVILVPISLLALSGETGQSAAGPLSGLFGLVMVCCLYVAFLLVMVVGVSIYAFGARGIVLRKLGIFEAIGHAWRALRENVGQVILLALPFVLVYVLLVILLYALMTVLVWRDVPSYPMLAGSLTAMYGRLGVLYLLFFVPIITLYAWQSATFTLAYLKWTGKDVLGAGLMPTQPPAEEPLA